MPNIPSWVKWLFLALLAYVIYTRFVAVKIKAARATGGK